LQGLILSNALRVKKNDEDESCIIALNNLRSEVIRLRNEATKKDKILLSLEDKVKEDEASFTNQSEAQKIEIEDLQKQLVEAKEKCGLAKANQDISEYWKNYLEKTVEELRASKERCFEKSLSCVEKIKTSFANVGPMLRRRRSYRKKRSSAEAVCIRWSKVPLREASVLQTDLKIE
jgi:transposase-like protein